MNDRGVVFIECTGYGRWSVVSQFPGQIHGGLPRAHEGLDATFGGHGLDGNAEHQRCALLDGSDGGAVHGLHLGQRAKPCWSYVQPLKVRATTAMTFMKAGALRGNEGRENSAEAPQSWQMRAHVIGALTPPSPSR